MGIDLSQREVYKARNAEELLMFSLSEKINKRIKTGII